MLFAYGMRQVLLCTLNAKYIHSSLALRSLGTYCRQQTAFEMKIKEFTINQNLSDIMAEIYMNRPDVLGFSCYIWNIRLILDLCRDYKKIAPHTVIILGGPEVSYDAHQTMLENPEIDYIVRGEGEETLRQLLQAVSGAINVTGVLGITYRDGENIHHNADRALISLDDIPFPYEDELDKLSDRIVYYESSRGCPFQCAYCLSANSGGIRYLSMSRVKRDLALMLRYKVREIKFVDRTFNCHEKRAQAIIDFIVAHRGSTKIHFEIDAGLFSDSMLEYLASVPQGLLNFEIGIQSTYEPALKAVSRKQNWERLSHTIKVLKAHNNIHLHLDLIAGLPGEDWEKITRSFNMVFNLQPDVLQFGFLKILKGTPLWRESGKYDYLYQSQSPYQILSNRDLTYAQIINLNQIEAMLDQYYNSGDMPHTLAYINEMIYNTDAFSFFRDLAAYWQSHGWFARGHKKEALYSMLQAFIFEYHPAYAEFAAEILKYDYLCHNHKYGLPQGLTSINPPNINNLIYSYAKDPKFVEQNLPQFTGRTAYEIKKLVHIEYFKINPVAYKEKGKAKLMFVYDPVARVANKVIDLSETGQGRDIAGNEPN
ncbi:MAG: B12-binding domain-containing radical SAM protein [Syntrophomonadaceae bacterium]|nr:B12-binding domain-containing radical SAM protein [Syntrophomonadaceae bacterium]